MPKLFKTVRAAVDGACNASVMVCSMDPAAAPRRPALTKGLAKAVMVPVFSVPMGI